VKDAGACPLEALSVYGPRQGFEEFLAKKRGVAVSQIEAKALPTEVVDYLDYQPQKTPLRWEFATRNFTMVLSYILFPGQRCTEHDYLLRARCADESAREPARGVRAEPLQAADGVHDPAVLHVHDGVPQRGDDDPIVPPAEEIPARAAACRLRRLSSHHVDPAQDGAEGIVLAKGILGVGAGIAAGWWLAPVIGHRLLGTGADGSISLLNTFWALVLPGMANGFSIFLLKGFFDSLPRELYEAADIDGANEWTKFWLITMNLSKPILAVMALGAFTAAYAEFLMALVIIPDPNMWTLMVWLYQMQASAHRPWCTQAS
jgi:hypothetical protein